MVWDRRQAQSKKMRCLRGRKTPTRNGIGVELIALRGRMHDVAWFLKKVELRGAPYQDRPRADCTCPRERLVPSHIALEHGSGKLLPLPRCDSNGPRIEPESNQNCVASCRSAKRTPRADRDRQVRHWREEACSGHLASPMKMPSEPPNTCGGSSWLEKRICRQAKPEKLCSKVSRLFVEMDRREPEARGGGYVGD